MTTTIQVIGASWHEVEVNAVHIRADSATAVLRDAQGERTAIAPEELPLGVVTAFAGVPFFLYLLRRAKNAAFF